jgi:hypothetical protein
MKFLYFSVYLAGIQRVNFDVVTTVRHFQSVLSFLSLFSLIMLLEGLLLKTNFVEHTIQALLVLCGQHGLFTINRKTEHREHVFKELALHLNV